MLLVIDNYDSFVHNLARYVRELGCEARVVRNDEVSVADVERLHPQAIILLPGPCTPAQAGISVELVRSLSDCVPILGVCLGHQAIGAALGGTVLRAPHPVHGMSCLIQHDGTGLFDGLPSPLRAARYHSLCVAEETLPAELRVTARSSDGVVMAFEHVEWPLFGVQFHPESVLTQSGHTLLANFLSLAGIHCGEPPAGDYEAPPEPLDIAGDAPALHW